MPIKPNKDFISRESPGIQKILNQKSSLLEELVNLASLVAIWSNEEIQEEKFLPVHQLFRFIFELIDAISVLVKYRCIDPCKILLRAVLESVLSIKYLLKKDTEKRLLAFMTCHWHQKINDLKKMNPDNQMHAQFLKIKQRDKFLRDIPLPEIPKEEINEKIESYKRLLNSSEYRESEEEYKHLKNARDGRKPKRKPKWYSMHEGPANIEQLADHFDLQLSEYELRYREWSGLIHGFDIIQSNIVIDDQGLGRMASLRSPEYAFEITKMAMQYGEEIIFPYLKYFASPEKVQKAVDLYSKEIKPLRNFVLGKKRIVVRNG
jgi:hypothetical protein